MAQAPENVRREKAQAVLKALRERAVSRNKVRGEIRALHSKGHIADTAKMPGWPAMKSAEERLNVAINEFEWAEGVDDDRK